MEEHIIVFDHPPGFGKGIPEFYDLEVFDVPQDKKDRIIRLLRNLGFVRIRDESIDTKQLGHLDGRAIENTRFIHAQYHTGTDQVEYENFWEKKEVIELEIDDLQAAHR